jgi:hypothetical protein
MSKRRYEMEKNILDWVALVLAIIGGLNWGLVAIGANLELFTLLGLGMDGAIARVVYGLIGLSALYTIYYLFKK